MIRINNKRNQKKHCSPLRYPGGKTFLFPYFDEVIRKNGLQNVTYIEPFAGGAGAALALLFAGKVRKVVINDLDKSIFSFWKSAIYHSARFIKKMQKIHLTVAEWKRQKANYLDPSSSEFDLGFATFFLNRTNVSGILDGGPIGGLDQSGKWKINARFNKETLINRIKLLASYKDKIKIYNQDGVKLIDSYLNKKNTFIYLDPPYFEKGATLYMNHYDAKNHQALAEKLNDNPHAFWLLTYDNKKEIRLLYPERKILNFSLNYNAYKLRKGREVMILSDTISKTLYP